MMDQADYTFASVSPLVVGEEAKWYEFCREHRLMIQRCSDCGNHQFPPRSVCQQCLADEVDWVEASGKGTIFSFTVQYRGRPDFADQTPYAIVMVDLEEGPRMMSRFVGPIQDVAVGLVVGLRWSESGDELSLPVFVAATSDV